ncbi:MAG: hypothetical protein JWQ30_2003 [Sediminibacterium sp.]|nr:hypothetical protein [Sediminibacterium sp.]
MFDKELIQAIKDKMLEWVIYVYLDDVDSLFAKYKSGGLNTD